MRTRTLDDYPGYEFREDGIVISYRTPGVHPFSARLRGVCHEMRGTADRDGYIRIKLGHRDGSRRFVYIHRVILEAYVGRCPEGMECRHLNGRPADNRVANLEWASHMENNSDKRRHGTYLNGERSGGAKLTNEQAAAIRRLYATGGYSHRRLAELFQCTAANIGHILNRHTFKEIA